MQNVRAFHPIIAREIFFSDNTLQLQKITRLCRENSKVSFFASLFFMPDGRRMLGEQRMLRESQQRRPLSVCAPLPSLLCRPRVLPKPFAPSHRRMVHSQVRTHSQSRTIDVPARADAKERRVLGDTLSPPRAGLGPDWSGYRNRQCYC